jgi:hypothetical protein
MSGPATCEATTNPGQHPRGAPDLMPIWTMLDCAA